MQKKITFFFLIAFLVIMSMSVSSFGLNSDEKSKVVLGGWSLFKDSFQLEGDYNGSLLKILVEKAGKQIWYEAAVSKNHFSKKILLNEGEGIYDIYIMSHKGNHDIIKAEHLKVNTFVNRAHLVKIEKEPNTGNEVLPIEDQTLLKNSTLNSSVEVSNNRSVQEVVVDAIASEKKEQDVNGIRNPEDVAFEPLREQERIVSEILSLNGESIRTNDALPKARPGNETTIQHDNSIVENTVRDNGVISKEQIAYEEENTFKKMYEEYLKEYYAPKKINVSEGASSSTLQMEIQGASSIDSSNSFQQSNAKTSVGSFQNQQSSVNNAQDSLIDQYRQDGNLKRLAENIIAGANSDYDKTKKIYDWVCKNITYDRPKYLNILKNDYSDEYGPYVALRTGKGVCYDYSALVVELTNAVGLQGKLIKGDYIMSSGAREYHAWNEVYISEQGRWISFDSTFGSVYGKDYFDNSNFNSNHEKQEVEEYNQIIRGRL